MDIHENARLTPYGRALLVRRNSGGRRDPEGRGHGLRGLAKNRQQMGRALPGRRPGRGLRDRSSRPPQAAPADVPGDPKAHRRAASPAHRRPADRPRHRASPPATVSRVLKRAGLSRLRDLDPRPAGAPLPARASRRADPSRHQEARPLRAARPPRHPAIAEARATAAAPSSAAPAGSTSTSASTTPPASPSARSNPTSARKAPSRSCTPPSPTTPDWASPSHRS